MVEVSAPACPPARGLSWALCDPIRSAAWQSHIDVLQLKIENKTQLLSGPGEALAEMQPPVAGNASLRPDPRPAPPRGNAEGAARSWVFSLHRRQSKSGGSGGKSASWQRTTCSGAAFIFLKKQTDRRLLCCRGDRGSPLLLAAACVRAAPFTSWSIASVPATLPSS